MSKIKKGEEKIIMIDVTKIEKIGEYEVTITKWFQGYLKEYYVNIYKNNKQIFEQDGLTATEATRLFKQKIKELNKEEKWKKKCFVIDVELSANILSTKNWKFEKNSGYMQNWYKFFNLNKLNTI